MTNNMPSFKRSNHSIHLFILWYFGLCLYNIAV